MRKFFNDTRAEIEESVFVLPVLLLVTFGLINLAMVGYAGLSAANAANYGARMASVSQANQAGIAVGAASNMLQAAPVGTYAISVAGGGAPGSLMSMASNYNSRGRAAEVMVSGSQAWLIRERETPAELFRGEHLLPT